MLGNMAAALSGGGLRSLYGGYTAFMLKGIPYDVAELFTYSQLAAMQKRMPAARCLPHYWSSIVIGQAATVNPPLNLEGNYEGSCLGVYSATYGRM